MNGKGWIAVLGCVSVLLAGCGTGRTLVMGPVKESKKFSAVQIERASDTISVDADADRVFRAELSRLLYEENKFTRGQGLQAAYRYVQLNQGDQFARWFTGGLGNTGEGSLTILVQFKDEKGNALGEIQVEGRIGSGFFGGDFDLALKKAAEQVATYIVANFR